MRKRGLFALLDILSNLHPMKTTISFLTQEETKRLFAAIPSKRDCAIFLIAYRQRVRALMEQARLTRCAPTWCRGDIGEALESEVGRQGCPGGSTGGSGSPQDRGERTVNTSTVADPRVSREGGTACERRAIYLS